MMTWQKTFETSLIRVFRAMNVLTLWDGRHFFGDNCPSNGCSMYHIPTHQWCCVDFYKQPVQYIWCYMKLETLDFVFRAFGKSFRVSPHSAYFDHHHKTGWCYCWFYLYSTTWMWPVRWRRLRWRRSKEKFCNDDMLWQHCCHILACPPNPLF